MKKELVKLEENPSWMIEVPNRITGEVKLVPKYKYMPGYPKEIRFDAKSGNFNNAGITKMGNELIMLPVAWRFFEDEILGMKRRSWAEIFFLDNENNICSILFHDYSVNNFKSVLPQLHYTDQELNQVRVKVTVSEHTALKLDGKPKYFLANFEFLPIEESETDMLIELYQFSQTQQFYRKSTLTPVADMELSFNYYNPYDQEREESI